jgi:hypothetical protein
MSAIRLVLISILLAFEASARTSSPVKQVATGDEVKVHLVDDEATSALSILEKEFGHQTLTDADWQRLFSAQGYVHLKERESYMRRAFTDSTFRLFMMSDTLIRRTPALRKTLSGMQSVDVSDAARQALTYLPKNARIVANLYPEIKPFTNSFVFSLDSIPGIFLYVDPGDSPAIFHNTLTHELHHIGLNSVCPPPDTTLPEPFRTLVHRMGGFGEGFAMLAAAGSADSDAQYVSDTATRNRWDRDVANRESNLRLLEKFFLDVTEGRITSPDSVNERAGDFYGVQGPWYTVGWKMSVTIEKVFGRQRLIDVMCDPRALLRTYNAAVPIWNRSHAEHLPTWSSRLMARLKS